MPYTEPTSPIPSPAKPIAPRRRFSQGSAVDTTPVRSVSNPMPSLPRRSPSLGSTVPRLKSLSLATTQPLKPPTAGSSAQGALDAMRSVEAIPRRVPQPTSSGSLGLKIHNGHAPEPLSSDSSAGVPSTPDGDSVPTLFLNNPPPPKNRSHSAHQPPRLSLGQRPKHGRERGNSATLPSPDNEFVASTYMRPTELVRKKSGEVVKSSLKVRSMSTPDLGRRSSDSSDTDKKTTRSTRDLQEHAKSVRFSDRRLESVVLFLREQKVTAISSAAADPSTETEDDNDTDLSDYVHFRTRRNGNGRSDDKEVEIDVGSRVPRLRTDFGPGTQGLLDSENVILERVEIVNGVSLALRGTVIARNVAFQKFIAVRFTLDHWQTVSEVAGTHIVHIPSGTTGDEGWDRFGFTVRLDDFKRKIEERSLELCVRYNCDGHEWWDSNTGSNYRFTFKRTSVRKPRVGTFLRNSTTETPSIPVLGRPSRAATDGFNPRNWVFPRSVSEPTRADSPVLSPPPAASFKAPAPPDVHSHLALKGWCAPSPPLSPPKKIVFPTSMVPLTLAPTHAKAAPAPNLTLVNGRPATVWAPRVGHNYSWSGEGSASIITSPTAISSSDSEAASDVTPTAPRARSPEIGGSSPESTTSTLDSPVKAPQASGIHQHNRSSSNLQSLADSADDNGLMTPPSSNLSSPPTPSTILPGPLSPSASLSTGDSSPVRDLLSESPSDLALNLQADDIGRTLNAASYQEFLDKFCFFKSPPKVTTPLDDHYAPRANYRSMSGFAPSGSGLDLYDGSRIDTPTPTMPYETLDSFPFGGNSSPNVGATNSGAGATPRASPSPSGRSPVAAAFGLPWTPGDGRPPSLAAA
ncbi:hypothetical protein Q8F55_000943 [Vanrija albida]|uniref:CBM21 domain-containing protein n=1 Tax=Vanrija albida TaxID=181172 RepID=A0ABR3QF81_9TREE